MKGGVKMDKEMLEQFQMIMQGMSEMEGRLREEIKASENRLSKRMDGLELYIENTVTKKIEALFDGYKLTHEKQWEMERDMQAMQRQMEDLQARLAALENKIA